MLRFSIIIRSYEIEWEKFLKGGLVIFGKKSSSSFAFIFYYERNMDE